jgi:hypothetical protein
VASVGDRRIVSLQDWISRGCEEVRQDEEERKRPKTGGAVTSWRQNRRRTPSASAGSDKKSRRPGGELGAGKRREIG